MLKATEAQRISTQVWRIPCEKISINAVSERPEEAVGVYVQDAYSIPAGMGKYIPVQTNSGVTGDVLIEISNKTVPGLVLPETIYNVKKKLGCIFVENHNSEPLLLKRGQAIGLVTSYVVMQAEQGQTQEMCKEDTQSITGRSNDTDTWIGGSSEGDAEKAGQKADSVQSIENRQFYKTLGEKIQFIHEKFQLDTNEILNADAKLKETVIKLFLDNFEVLATHSSQYGETKVLEIKSIQFQGRYHINHECDLWILTRKIIYVIR